MSVAAFDRMSLTPFARRNALLSVAILGLDVAAYAAFVYGAIVLDGVWLKSLCSLGAGVMIALMFIAGHDAAHQSFSTSKTLNRVLGTLALLPGLHPYTLWEYHHNKVHHRFTAQIGVDNAFSPMTVEQYRAATPFRRGYYRFMRSLWGQPWFYLVDIWWPQVFLPFGKNEPKVSRETFAELVLVWAYTVAFAGACMWLAHARAPGVLPMLEALLFAFIVPFLLWNVFIAFLTVVQHTGPDVRWSLPTGLPSSPEQTLAGTVHVVLPQMVCWLFHRIMQHPAHHLNVGIPLHRLKEAESELEASEPRALVRVWTPAYHWRLTRECQLYDPAADAWIRFADLDAPARARPDERRAAA
jgi:omega-6 fatty acid desaturase (delta-12 desaturase)